jgi:hypothetical protein
LPELLANLKPSQKEVLLQVIKFAFLETERFKYYMYYKYYMTEKIVSVRVGSDTYERMRKHREINWSAVIRGIILQKLESVDTFDFERAKRASRDMDRIRKSGVFSGGKKAEELIREWRDKRK